MAAGTRLGPYEILAPVGAGGMGEVYRARDTRLGREVAIKVLPSHLAGAELRQRFEREARAISAFQHPHICTLYDIGEREGSIFLVMEYLEGETLADRLTRGHMPISQVLKSGMEIADALDKAHRHGLIHRDLKPSNVMLTKSGAKLMDFGLAKAIEPASTGNALSAMVTAERPLTEEGVIVGTFQYMAPEQLEARPTDARTDIFALGAVLYQMATGKPAFNGRTKASLIASILAAEPPPMTALEPRTPPAFDRVVRICLAKDPDERWQTAHDVKLQLEGILLGSTQAAEAVRAPGRRWRAVLPWGIALLTLVLGFAGGRLWRSSPAAQPRVRFSIAPRNPPLSPYYVKVSPDGRALAYLVTGNDKKIHIAVRWLDSGEEQPVAGTEGTNAFFWAPDSRALGYFANGKLYKIALPGGSAEEMCSGQGSPVQASWGSRGVVLAAQFPTGPLQATSVADCKVSDATPLDTGGGELNHMYPQFLPDGSSFLFAGRKPGEKGDEFSIYAGKLGTHERHLLVAQGSRPHYVEPGFLVFSKYGRIFGQRFDPKTLKTEGAAFPALDERVNFSYTFRWAEYSVSPNGVLAYQHDLKKEQQLTWVDRAGREIGRIEEPAFYDELALSPDATRVISGRMDPENNQRDLWVYDIPRRLWSRLTFNPSIIANPVWAPDGRSVLFAALRQGKYRIYRQDLSGGPEQLFLEAKQDAWPDDWSADGKLVLFEELVGQSTVLRLIDSSGKGEPVSFASAPNYDEYGGRFSADGHWVAYVSNETGSEEVYVRGLSGGQKWRVSSAGGTYPEWSDDGHELLYYSADHKLVAVDVQIAGTFHAGPPHPLFAIELDGYYRYDHRNRRFLIPRASATTSNTLDLQVVVNWSPAPGN
ncbi:MAG TPA: protein kinase [Terriglobales bacterium]|nr:protein kinase [Terriglobales bacterium]